MKIPPGATSYSPPYGGLSCGTFTGKTHRHTVRPAGSKDWLVIYTLRGSGHYEYPGGNLQTEPHDLTLYRPGVFQDYRRAPSVARWDLLFAHFPPRTDWIPWLDWPEVAPGFHCLQLEEGDLRERVIRRWREMIHLQQGSETRREAFALNALEEVLLWCDSGNPRRAHLGIDPRVRRAMDFLSQHSEEPFDETRIARAAGLSASRLRHVFREQAGVPPREFHEQQRLRKARDLLALSSLSIGEVARSVGFENPFYFTLRFKKHTGESPREFRRREVGQG